MFMGKSVLIWNNIASYPMNFCRHGCKRTIEEVEKQQKECKSYFVLLDLVAPDTDWYDGNVQFPDNIA